MKPILKEWVEEIGQHVTPTALLKVDALILSEVEIPSRFLPAPTGPWRDHQCPGAVHTIILHFRRILPQVVDILSEFARDQEKKGPPFEVLRLHTGSLGAFYLRSWADKD
jgi:hypothetical protein